MVSLIETIENIKYDANNILGNGETGQVSSVVYSGSFGNINVAVKKASHVTYRISGYSRENPDFKFFNKRGHSNIVRLFNIESKDLYYYIAMEICDFNYKDFFTTKIRKIQLLRKKLTSFTVTRNILSGVEYLHKNKMIHGYINPRNVMICKSSMCAKLSDYGLDNTARNLESL